MKYYIIYLISKLTKNCPTYMSHKETEMLDISLCTATLNIEYINFKQMFGTPIGDRRRFVTEEEFGCCDQLQEDLSSSSSSTHLSSLMSSSSSCWSSFDVASLK